MEMIAYDRKNLTRQLPPAQGCRESSVSGEKTRFLRGEAGGIRGFVDKGMGFLGSQRENVGEDGEVGH